MLKERPLRRKDLGQHGVGSAGSKGRSVGLGLTRASRGQTVQTSRDLMKNLNLCFKYTRKILENVKMEDNIISFTIFNKVILHAK